jgi:hypothetical protein
MFFVFCIVLLFFSQVFVTIDGEAIGGDYFECNVTAAAPHSCELTNSPPTSRAVAGDSLR